MTTPDADRWQRIQRVLDDALELASSDRSAYLDRVCREDVALRREVENYLSADEQGHGDILDAPSGLFLLDRVASLERDAGDSTGLLSGCEPFDVLAPDVFARVLECMHEERYEPGQLLMHQGDPGGSLMVVVTGRARVTVRAPDGSRHDVRQVEPMGLVGEMALLTNEPRNADVVAETSLVARVLSVAAFEGLARQYPELSVVLTELMAARLGRSAHDGLGGMKVGGYRIRRCIGRGGMAMVYEAESVDTGRRVALKMMSHRLSYQPNGLSRFRREAGILERVRHDNVVSLYAHFAAYKTRFLALEYCDGPTLEDVLRKQGRLSEELVRSIVGQLATALVYVHDRGILHRDLKPSNVLLNRDGTVKLSDFGLARSEAIGDENLSQARLLIGTPAYMAPEQLAGCEIDERADLYGLACVAHELLEGQSVFRGRAPMALLDDKRRFSLPGARQIGGGVSEEMHGFLTGALAADPAERVVRLQELVAWAAPADAELFD